MSNLVSLRCTRMRYNLYDDKEKFQRACDLSEKVGKEIHVWDFVTELIPAATVAGFTDNIIAGVVTYWPLRKNASLKSTKIWRIGEALETYENPKGMIADLLKKGIGKGIGAGIMAFGLDALLQSTGIHSREITSELLLTYIGVGAGAGLLSVPRTYIEGWYYSRKASKEESLENTIEPELMLPEPDIELDEPVGTPR